MTFSGNNWNMPSVCEAANWDDKIRYVDPKRLASHYRRQVVKIPFDATPGTVIVEFLDPIARGRGDDALLDDIEERVEAASEELAAHAAQELRARGLI